MRREATAVNGITRRMVRGLNLITLAPGDATAGGLCRGAQRQFERGFVERLMPVASKQ